MITVHDDVEAKPAPQTNVQWTGGAVEATPSIAFVEGREAVARGQIDRNADVLVARFSSFVAPAICRSSGFVRAGKRTVRGVVECVMLRMLR